MTYRLPNPSKETNCKNCLFAIYHDKTQIGCEDNRIEKFKNFVTEAYDNDKEFFVIDRICNLYRTEKWNNGIKDIHKAKRESSISFDIFIDCENIDDEYINKILHEINNINYPKEKIFLLLFHSENISQDNKIKLLDLSKKLFNTQISIYFNKIEYIYSILSKTKKTFHIFLDKNNIEHIGSLLNDANNLMNEDLKRFIVLKNTNKTMISNLAVRIFYPNLYIDYLNNIIKLEEEAKKDNLYIEI